ncbi:hypothetical protein ACFV2U_46060 [Streptomyces sp. NPDC059697]|uniref:hypothetical protein n=1 Tax=Streptomyces sp. NPDC059697 TaxID=3346912 RepID=UPI0036B395EF
MVRIEGLAQGGGHQLLQGVRDVLVVLGEDLRGEADDGAGDGIRRVCPGVRAPDAQGVQEDGPEFLQGERAHARHAVLCGDQRGDRDDDAVGDVYEQGGHLRLLCRELDCGVDVAGLHCPEVVEGADDRVRSHRSERRGYGGLGHGQHSSQGDRRAGHGVLIHLRAGHLWTDSGDFFPPVVGPTMTQTTVGKGSDRARPRPP